MPPKRASGKAQASFNGPTCVVYRSGVRCEDCKHFIPDPINPPVGVGTCRIGQGGYHAGAPHHCIRFTGRTS